MKSPPRSLIFVCVLHPNGQGKRCPVFQSPNVGPPQVFACFAPGRDSTSVAGSGSFAASGVSTVSSDSRGLGGFGFEFCGSLSLGTAPVS